MPDVPLFGYPNYVDPRGVYTPVLSGGSWNTALPLANLQDRKLDLIARSTDDALASTIIKADLGTARSVRIVALPKSNLSSAAKWRVRGFAAEPVMETSDFSGMTTVAGTPTVTAGQTDPLGGTRASLIEDNDATTAEAKRTAAITFGSDGTKGYAISLAPGTAARTTVIIYDSTALTERLRLHVDWSGGVPTPSVGGGSGTLYAVQLLANGHYQIQFLAAGIVAANTNYAIFYPSNTGTAHFYEFMAFDLASQPILADSGILDAWPSGVAAEDFPHLYDVVNTSHHRIHAPYVLSSAVSARYWRVEIADTANPDGYVDLARLVIAGAVAPSMAPNTGASFAWLTRSSFEETDGGARVYDERPRRRALRMAFSDLTEATGLAFDDMRGALGSTGQLYAVGRLDGDTTQLWRRCFLGTLRELTALEYTRTTGYAGSGISVEEDL